MSKKLQQHGGHLVAGDIIRILDAESSGAIAVCVESDGHREYPYCCMVVSDQDREREELWPAEYEKLGNVNEMVGLLEVLRARPAQRGSRVITGKPIPRDSIVFTAHVQRKPEFEILESKQLFNMNLIGAPAMKAKRKKKNP